MKEEVNYVKRIQDHYILAFKPTLAKEVESGN